MNPRPHCSHWGEPCQDRPLPRSDLLGTETGRAGPSSRGTPSDAISCQSWSAAADLPLAPVWSAPAPAVRQEGSPHPCHTPWRPPARGSGLGAWEPALGHSHLPSHSLFSLLGMPPAPQFPCSQALAEVAPRRGSLPGPLCCVFPVPPQLTGCLGSCLSPTPGPAGLSQ